MTAYWLVAFLALIFNLTLPRYTDKKYLLNLIIAFVPLFIYAAIRVDYGNDYPTYEQYFDFFHGHRQFYFFENEHAEIGYQYLCHVMPSYRSILVLNAFLLAASLIYFIYKNVPEKYSWLAIILLFLMPEKNIFGVLVGIRVGLVISLLLLTFSFIKERKLVHTCVVAVLLSTIHTSAILYIPLAYFVARNTPMTRKELYFWIISGTILMTMSMSSLIDLVMPIFSLVADRYESQLMGMDEESKGMLNYVANIVMMAAFVVFAYRRRLTTTSDQNSLLRMAALYCMAGCLGGLSGRMTYYFAMYYIGGVVLMYSMPWHHRWLKNLMLAFVIMIAYYATFKVWMGSQWWNHQVYHSLWGNL